MKGKRALTPPRSFMSPRIRSKSGPARIATEIGMATRVSCRAGTGAGVCAGRREEPARVAPAPAAVILMKSRRFMLGPDEAGRAEDSLISRKLSDPLWPRAGRLSQTPKVFLNDAVNGVMAPV